MRLGLITLIAAGCSFRASYDGTHYKCGDGDTCPSGQTCVAGECVLGSFDAPPGTPDAPPGTPDAPIGTPDAPIAQGRCGTVALFRDPFDSGSLLPWWDPWTDGGPTVSEANSRLVIALPGGSAGSSGPWAGAGSRYAYDFTESRVEVSVSQVGGTDTVVEVRGIGGGKLQMVVEQGTLYAGVFNVPGEGTRAQLTYDPAVHKKWRIRESAGVSYWEWSTDGTTWTELWHESDPFPPDHVYVQLAAGGQKTSASEAHFDNINTAVTVPAGFCGASSVVDDFSGAAFGPQWTSWADAPATIAMTGGDAVVTTSGANNLWAGFQTNHLYDLTTGAFYVDARSMPQLSPFVSWTQAIAPVAGGGNKLEINVEGTSLQLLQAIGGTTVSSKSTTYDPAAQRYWRMRADATTIYLETSPDASTWTTRLSAAAQLDPTAVQLVVGAGEYGAMSAQTARFGGVNTP